MNGTDDTDEWTHSEDNIHEKSSFLPKNETGQVSAPVMAARATATELDICLARCSNPLLSDIPIEQIDEICSLCAVEQDGAQKALAFLAYKAQSPQEYEALHALAVLEKVVKQGGLRIADEVNKFRFLNELIQVVSPKYLAHRTTPKVKQRIVELIFAWSMQFKDLPNIFTAYQMMKVQKIVSEDPVHVLENFRPPSPPPPRPRDDIFDDEDTVKRLKSLMEKGTKTHLKTANRIIKTLAQKAETRAKFQAQFGSEMDQIYNCSQLLTEMVTQSTSGVQLDDVTRQVIYPGARAEDLQLMRELYENCEKSRLRLFKLSNQVECIERELAGPNGTDPEKDEDSSLNQLIRASEMLTTTLHQAKSYFNLIEDSAVKSKANEKESGIFGFKFSKSRSNSVAGPQQTKQPERLLDLNSSPIRQETRVNSLENLIADMKSMSCAPRSRIRGNTSSGLDMFFRPQTPNLESTDLSPSQMSVSSTANILDSFGRSKESGSNSESATDFYAKEFKFAKIFSEAKKIFGNVTSGSTSGGYAYDSLGDLKNINELLKKQHLDLAKESSIGNSTKSLDSPTGTHSESALLEEEYSTTESLTRLLALHSYISPNTIIPASIKMKPLKMFMSKDSIQVMLHFTGNRPHPQLLVFLITISNFNEKSISDVQFSVAVSKEIKAKLLSQNGTWLPACKTAKSSEPASKASTLVPSNFISQVLLVAFNQTYLEQNIVVSGSASTPSSESSTSGTPKTHTKLDTILNSSCGDFFSGAFDIRLLLLDADALSGAVTDPEYLFRIKFKLSYCLEGKGKSEQSGKFNWMVPKRYLDSEKKDN